jgi:hypothetical protein
MSIWDNIDDIEDDFDDEIPDEVLNDPSWEPRLLPENLNKLPNVSINDLIAEEYDGDGYGADTYEDEEW